MSLICDYSFNIINRKNQRMARYPNYNTIKKTDAYQSYSADAFSKERVAR